MAVQAIGMLATIIITICEWFAGIFNKTRGLPVYLFYIGVFMAVRFLLAPLFGHAMAGASDLAARHRNKRKED